MIILINPNKSIITIISLYHIISNTTINFMILVYSVAAMDIYMSNSEYKIE